jgi:hypothetical protein
MNVIEHLIQTFDAEEIERPSGCRDGGHVEHWWPTPRHGIACLICTPAAMSDTEWWVWRGGQSNRPIDLGRSAA